MQDDEIEGGGRYAVRLGATECDATCSMGKVVGFVRASGRERCGGSRELMGVVDLEYSTGSN